MLKNAAMLFLTCPLGLKVMLNRFWASGVLLGSLSCIAIANAYYKKQQFYPTCMHLINSNASYMILICTFLYLSLLLGRILQNILFGELRIIEIEHLYENIWYSLSELFLAVTIFREDFDSWVTFYFVLLFALKSFHWILKDRLDYMEQTPLLSKRFHLRMVSVILFLAIFDISYFGHAILSLLNHSPSLMILFAFETGILIVDLILLSFKYLLNFIDMRQSSPWEAKSSYFFFSELLCDFLKVSLYLTFFGAIVVNYGLPLHILRDLFMTLRSFIMKIRDWIMYRKAVKHLNEKYPWATAEELSSTDKICIICREEMKEAKKLSCGHYFHFGCLRSWLERQQSCPTCRKPILQTAPNVVEEAAVPPLANQPIALDNHYDYDYEGYPGHYNRINPRQDRSASNSRIVLNEEALSSLSRLLNTEGRIELPKKRDEKRDDFHRVPVSPGVDVGSSPSASNTEENLPDLQAVTHMEQKMEALRSFSKELGELLRKWDNLKREEEDK